jgi:hypothetical protein
MKSLTCRKLIPFIVLAGEALIHPAATSAQCNFPAPGAASCSGGNGALTNGTNINSNQTYWYSASTGTRSNINMNGGVLRVCGTLTLSSINFNSGTIIVESSGTLIINNSSEIILSGLSSLTNRGSLTINANLQMRNQLNVIWNDNNAAVLTVNGTITINSSSSYIINKGILKATRLVVQSNADEGSVCTRDNAIMNVGSLVNNADNAFSYSGLGSPGCLSVSGAYTLNAPFTSSAGIKVCKIAGSSTGGSENWGTAVVTNGCSSCSAVLPLHITSFTANRQGNGSKLAWTIADNGDGGEYFFVERSVDGLHFTAIASIAFQQGKSDYSFYDATGNQAEQYYRIRQSGITSNYSSIVLVKTVPAMDQPINVYPNPLSNNRNVTVAFTAAAAENIQLSLTAIGGKTVLLKKEYVTRGKNTLQWGLTGVPPGVYVIRLQSASMENIYKRITIVGSK